MKIQDMVDVNINTMSNWTCEIYNIQVWSIKYQQVLKNEHHQGSQNT